MPEDPQFSLAIEPPFGGINQVVSPRGIHPRFAMAAKNCWVRDGTIDVRDPFFLFSTTATWASGIVVANIPWDGVKMACVMRATVPLALDYLFVHVKGSGSNAYVIVDPDGSQVAIFTSDISGGETTAVQVNEALYLWHDFWKNKKVYWDVGGAAWVCENAGIARYAGTWTQTAVNLGAGGFAAGTIVHHRFTYLNDKPNMTVESGPSDDGTATHATQSFDVQLTMPDSGDGQVTKVRVYRMVEGMDDTWFLLGEYAPTGPTVVTDTNAAIDKSFDQQLNEALDAPPLSRAAAWHKGRMWYAPVDAEGFVRHSELYRPENVNPLNDYNVGGPNGQYTRAMFSMGGYLFVVRSHSVYAISGDGPESFVSEELNPNADCISPHSVITVGNQAAFWAGRAGAYQLDGRGIRKISGPIDAAWSEINEVYRKPRVTIAWDAKRQLLWVCAPWQSASGTDLWLYDPEAETWAYVEVPDNTYGLNWIFSYAPNGTSPVGHARPFALYREDPNTLDLIGVTTPAQPNSDWRDFGATPVAWSWQTPEIDCGQGGWKRFGPIGLAWNPNGAASDAIKLGWRLDGLGAFTQVAGALDNVPATLSTTIARLAATVALELEGSATKQTRITRMMLRGEVVGGSRGEVVGGQR